MEQPLPPTIETLLQDLRATNKEAYVRKVAAENLGVLKTTDGRIVEALKTAAQSDTNKYVRYAAEKALRDVGIAPEEIPREQVLPRADYAQAPSMKARWWRLLLPVGVVVFLVILLLPIQASGRIITVKCGNFFKAQSLGGESSFVEIVEGFDRAATLSYGELRYEFQQAGDACTKGAWGRMIITAAVITACIGAVAVGESRARRTRRTA